MNTAKTKTGVFLINLGTPDSYQVADVRRYLREFLMDRRVIDIPAIQRFLLVCGIIAPFRAPESAKVYKELWTEKGSPLKYYGEELKAKLQSVLGTDFQVEFAMRYKNPNVRDVIKNFENVGINKLIIIPMYPQYASSTTGSTIEYVMQYIRDWEVIPHLTTISQFFDNPAFIDSFAKSAKPLMQKTEYDHFIFSYHGIPERHIKKSSCQNYCQLNEKCCSVYHAKNQFCYRAQCFATTRLLTAAMNIPEENYTISFQSRLGKDPWIKPYTDEIIKTLPSKGIKKVLAFSPAFVTDCLETTIEVGEEYKELFVEHGGEQWDLVESLNAKDEWVSCLKEIVLSQS